jgi:hypothetical protein
MTNDDRESRPDAIERLIADEDAEALVEFRTRDFPDLVERRIAEAGRRRRPAFSGRFLRPVTVVAAAVLACAVIAYLVLPHGSSVNESAAMIQRALQGMPGLQPPDKAAAGDADAGSASGSASPLSFAAVLASAYGEITAGEREGAGASDPAGERRAPRLSLREKYKILIIEKSVERVLAQLTNKFKEG